MSSYVHSENIRIVLVKPRYPENIGAAARAMCNMGFSRLVVISPEDFDLTRIKKTATHEASQIVDKIEICANLNEVLDSCNFVVGTTARLGKQRRKASTPSSLSGKIKSVARINQVAILFGPEDRGLENNDILFCDALINIPTFGFSSLNLAHSVMIICYELATSSTEGAHKKTPKIAEKRELGEMYNQLENVLVETHYMNPENPHYFLNQFRHLFSRIELRSKEVVVIRGLLKKIKVYGDRMYQKGVDSHLKK